ncbi:MAG: transglutaminase family protein [Chloroflexi bacterium]|nr:transglutaminase family protein [Chloroflexota bacterium]
MEEPQFGDGKGYIIDGSIFDYRPVDARPALGGALARFEKLAQLPDDQIDLAEAALMIASFEYAGLNEVYYYNRLDEIADEARPLFASETNPMRNIEKLNLFLNQNLGFHGNETDYNDRRNSFLNDVLERRTGIPITLSLVYIELGKRLGLHFEGIGLPGHFIIRYRDLETQPLGSGEWLNSGLENLERQEEAVHSSGGSNNEILLDPFNGGAILSEEDCIDLVRERYGRILPLQPLFTRPVTNRQFLVRMLNNIKASCIGEEDYIRALQMQECLVILNPNSAEEHRDRGVLYFRSGEIGPAIVDFRYYLRKAGDASDAGLIRKQLGLAMDQLVQRN